jgi:hypothetical protein
MSEIRLGDIIDDYCGRCRLLSNHAVVSLLVGEVKKVRCRTCNHEHNFRHGRGGNRRRSQPSAYEQVLASITGTRFGMPEPQEKKKERKREGAQD